MFEQLRIRILTHDNRGYAPEPGGSRQNFPLCDEVRRLFQCAGTGLTTSAGQLRTLIGSHEGLARFNDGTQQDMEGVLIALINLIEEEITRGGVKSQQQEKVTTTRMGTRDYRKSQQPRKSHNNKSEPP